MTRARNKKGISKKKEKNFTFCESKLLGLKTLNWPSDFISVRLTLHFVSVFSPHLCGSAAGPVRGPHCNVDTGRGLRVCSVSPLGGRQPRDDQAAGETPLPKQKAQRGGRRRDLRGKRRHFLLGAYVQTFVFFSRREETMHTCSYLT